MEKRLWLEGNSHHHHPQSLGIHMLGNTLPIVINFTHYLDWFSSPLKRGIRAKRLENLFLCFSLQNLGKELHWQNCLHLGCSFTQPPTTQCLGAWKSMQGDILKTPVLEKLEGEDKSFSGHSCIILWLLISVRPKITHVEINRKSSLLLSVCTQLPDPEEKDLKGLKPCSVSFTSSDILKWNTTNIFRSNY